MKMINTFRTGAIVASGYLLTALPTLAQESGGSSAPVTASGDGWSATFTIPDKITSVDSAASGAQSMLSNILSQLVKPIGLVLLAGLAIWAMPRIIGILKTAFSSGKGR